jgi:hypothetical protein
MDSLFGLDRVSGHDDSAALLTTVHDNVELSIIRSILESEQIPYRVRERGSGGMVRVIAGYSMYGSDVFVPAEMLPQVQELLDAYRNGADAEESDAATGGEADE